MSDAIPEEAAEAPAPAVEGPAKFDDFPISEPVRAAIKAMGYVTPTDVQSASIEIALSGRDLVVQAKTGSGKTSAFGIPIVERLEGGTATPGAPLALILAPTRELALQVSIEMRALAGEKGIRCEPIYGGVSMGQQTTALKKGTEVVCGTPGRLLDHIRRGNMRMNELKYVVLDEADEMLSMGFWDDVTDLIKMAPKTRQTWLFSATLPYQVARAAAEFLTDPARIDVSGDELTVEGIENLIYNVEEGIPKPRQLLYVLETEAPSSAIIFCNTRNETEMIAKYLTQAGFIAEAITGNFRQTERERVMARIKGGDLRYMIATDVAARGIDIADLSHVFQYSLPEFSEVYLHRVGRTGRIGKVGTAISLVDGKGLGTLSVLEREFGIKFTYKQLPPQADVLHRRSERIMKELSEQASVAEVGQHLPVAEEILEHADAAQVVAFLLKSFFNQQASDSRRPSGRSHSALESADVPEPRAPRASRPPRERDAAAAASEGEGEGKPRRKRRRRRKRAGSSEESAPKTAAYADAVGMDEILAGSMTPDLVAPVTGGNGAAPPATAEPVVAADGRTRLRVNIGFDDGFKGRGAVAKKIAALAGLNDGIVTEVESKRDHAVLSATPEIADLVVERVDGAQLGKKIISVAVAD